MLKDVDSIQSLHTTHVFVVVHVQYAIFANGEVAFVVVANLRLQLRRRVQCESTSVDDLLLRRHLCSEE